MSVNAAFQRVCPAAEIAKGTVVGREVSGVPIALVHCEDGTFRAVADECSHQDVPLSEGDVDGCTLECSRFDLRTGAPSGPPATEPVAVYPVEIRDGDLYVSLVPANGVTQ
jgi:3-phenylpropionate/trans-cinnamate dioxygenase ferredoxin subunit